MMNAFALLVIFWSLVVTSCGFGDQNASALQRQANADDFTPINSGSTNDTQRDIEISVVNVSKGRATVTVKNVTDHVVYLRFNPAGNGFSAPYVVFSLKRLNGDGQYAEYGESGHYAPPLNPIQPQDSITFPLSIADEGTYRVVFRYLADESLAKALNERFTVRDLTAQEELQVRSSFREAVSSDFVL